MAEPLRPDIFVEMLLKPPPNLLSAALASLSLNSVNFFDADEALEPVSPIAFDVLLVDFSVFSPWTSISFNDLLSASESFLALLESITISKRLLCSAISISEF
ncbi:hypothetical protein ACX2RO_000017 [Acinetobacter baumannii]